LITHNKRDTIFFADYRLGIRFIMVGTKLPAIKSIRNSKVWSNNVPVFGPSFCSNDVSGLLKVTFPSIEVDASWKTNITILKALLKGSIIESKEIPD
jgi:hypothetical protein